MHVLRTVRLSAAVLAATLTVGTLGTGAAFAGKPAPAPTGLAATVTAHANGSYDVAASWNASPNATSYRVALTLSGATLSSATVTTTTWTPTVTAAPGNASLSVRAVVGRRPGKTATISVPLPDVTAPRGSYSSTWDNDTGLATITQDSLTDNSPVSGVTRTVSWGEGSPVVWPAGTTTITHTYPVAAKRFTPTVTLEDAAHNVNVVDVPAIVLLDSQAPTGAFAVSPASAWATFTTVTVTQQGALADNWSPPNHITRSVDWGDGTTTDWTSAAPATHLYATAGSYTPVVTITDEAHNANPVSTSGVEVTADTVGPQVRIAAGKPRHSVAAWRTLHGSATDTAGTGVKTVSLKVVEKRGTTWYGYNAVKHTWVKAATRAKAFKRSTTVTRTTNATHHWSLRLRHLTRGTLVAKAWAVDQVANRSVTVSRTATLTRR
jgi:hypothetical protein